MDWSGALPLLLIGLVLLVLLIAALELGYRAGPWLRRRFDRPEPEADAREFLLSAVLGLLALLLGFTFSLSLQRHEARRMLVVAEANALGTAWHRLDLFDEPARGRMAALLRAYVDSRLAWSEGDTDLDPKAAAQFVRSTALENQLWAEAVAAERASAQPVVAAKLLDPLNEAFDIAASRKAARAAHVPEGILNLLVLYMLIATFMVGHVLSGYGRRQPIPTLTTIVLLTLALTAILDLDRPRSNGITVSQQPMLDLRAAMGSPSLPQ